MAAEKVNVVELYKMCSTISKQLIAEADKSNDKMTISENVLNSLRESFKHIIEFEKSYLTMAEDSFYGMLLMNMETEIDFKIKGAIDVDVSEEPFTIKINPLFCADYKFPEFTGLFVSEILKLIYDHPSLFAALNKGKDNKAHGDLERASSTQVSGLVKNDIRLDSGSSNGLRLPHDAYTLSSMNDEVKVNPQEKQSFEYYYNILKKFRKEIPSMGFGGVSGGTSIQQGNQDSNSLESSENSGKSEGNSNQNGNQSQKSSKEMSSNQVSTPNNNQGDATHSWEDQGTEDELHDKVVSFVKDTYDNMDEQRRGLIPASIQSQIKALLAPPQINWKKELRRMIGSTPVPYRQTRTRLNRRQPYRTDLSGRLPKRVVDIVVVFDTSGSMSDKCLEYCFTEVLNIIKDYEGTKVTVVECDAEVTKVYQCKNVSQFQTKVTGRGGTSFVPAIEFINGEKPYNKKYPGISGKFRNGFMVYFTDGFGDYEIPQPKTYRNMWVVLDDVKNLSVKEPYGKVVSLSTDKDYQRYIKGI